MLAIGGKRKLNEKGKSFVGRTEDGFIFFGLVGYSCRGLKIILGASGRKKLTMLQQS